MDLNNKNVCFVAAFNCPYGGNFIPMLRSLAYRLRDNFYVQVSFYGIPVIQSDIPGTYWNSKNSSFMLFRSRDAKDLSVKMEQMMNADSIELQKKCEITKSKNEELLSLDTWVSKIIDCYHSL